MSPSFDIPIDLVVEAARRREEALLTLARQRLELETDLMMALHERTVAIATAQDANYRARLLRVDLEAVDRKIEKVK